MSDPVSRLNAALEGRYAIERELGEGGMATVYLADDLKHERRVALKVLKPELAAVVGAERFLGEIKTTANLQHPHILPLFDSGEADGYLFYVMPYVEGETLRDRIDREKQLSVDEAVRIASAVASGGPGMGDDLEVKVLPEPGRRDRREAQGVRREAYAERSVKRTRESTNRNRIRGAADRGERTTDREAPATKGKRRRSGDCAGKVIVLTRGGLA